jgi:putative ABC transport system permease protein
MTSLMRVKLRRDLRANRSRLALMVVAITVSLTVFGAMLTAWATISREVESAYTSTEPASATLLLSEGLDEVRMTEIVDLTRDQPQVIAATGRALFTSDVEVNGQLRALPLQVVVAASADAMQVATFDIERGSWPPASDEILLRHDSLGLLGMRVGDTVTITPPGGRPISLRVADTVYDPSLSPSPQEQRGYAYVSTDALAMSGQQAPLDQVKIQIAEPGQTQPSGDRQAIVDAATAVGEWLQREHGLRVRELQVPPPFEHPHEAQADALLLSLLGGAAAAVLLSTILVANMLNNLFTRQVPQIGILKAIGARSGRIARAYLAMTGLVAAMATALALWPAVAIGRFGVDQITGFLGVQATNRAAPWWTYFVVVVAGLGFPLLMTLPPLLRTSRITVRAAIDDHGSGRPPSTATSVLAMLSRTRRIDRGYLMALRNTVRRPARFLLAVSLLAVAGAVFVAGLSLNTSTQATNDERRQQRTWDVDVQLANPSNLDDIVAVLEGTPDLDQVEGFHRTQTAVAGAGQIPVMRTYPDQGHGSVSITAIPAGSTLVPPRLLAGRWLEDGETDTIVLNQIARNNITNGAQTGDTVELLLGGRITTWRVVGVVEEREGGSGGAYVTAEGLATTLGEPTRVTVLRIATTQHDEPTRQAVADAVGTALTNADIDVRSSASVSRSDAISAGHLGPILMVLLGVAVPLAVIGTIGLASTMSANILDRTREFGVMHAIGARPKAVRRIVIAEGLILALTSCVIAIAPALVLTAMLGSGLGNLFMYAPLPFRVSFPGVAIWIVLVTFAALLATEAAATRASRMTVREALSQV